jgi:hypothetical protein
MNQGKHPFMLFGLYMAGSRIYRAFYRLFYFLMVIFRQHSGPQPAEYIHIYGRNKSCCLRRCQYIPTHGPGYSRRFAG